MIDLFPSAEQMLKKFSDPQTYAIGVKELFTPGTSTQEIIRFVTENIRAAV